MNTESISPRIRKRRANANFILVGVWAAVAGMLATVPIAIRQRDWKVSVIPAFFAFVCAFAAESAETQAKITVLKASQYITAGVASADFAETKEMTAVFETLKYTSSGVLAATLVKQNKEKAQQS